MEDSGVTSKTARSKLGDSPTCFTAEFFGIVFPHRDQVRRSDYDRLEVSEVRRDRTDNDALAETDHVYHDRAVKVLERNFRCSAP